LVTGGTQNDDAGLNSTELNDPSTEIWTNTGSMNYGRSLYTVSVLTNGTVLVTGGKYARYTELNSIEL
jgi:hypothetical protein